MVKYNVSDDKGNVTTKLIPGQTSFEPMVLLRSMDLIAEQIYSRFYATVEGQLKNIKKNYSVSMNDANGDPLVIWDLENALPTKVSGFDFNMTTEAEYASFEITLQAELITVTFLPEATVEAIAQAIEYWVAKESGEIE
jgi:phage tail-like protein